MVDSFNRQVLRVAVAQICQSMGWDALQKSTHDTLTDVLQRYLEEIGKVALSYTQLCNRTKPNLDDLHLAFQDTGVALKELENFVAQVDPVQFIHPFTTYPKCQPCRLQHPRQGEIVDRAEFYSEHLPSLPKTCQEPKDEKEDSTTGENIKVASSEETAKIKITPLKESINVMDTSDNVQVKRRHEGNGSLFPRDNKRSRLDIPENLILEKKENLENTDGESLSPATPVSPYLPQDIPKLPEEPAKPHSFVKVKTEPKQVPNLTKEMVLPLQKLTSPQKKTKTETSPSSKKPKINKEKSISPNLQNKSLSSPKTELLSPVKKPSSNKKSPSVKVKSPMKAKLPMVEKPVIKKFSGKGNENKAPSHSSKSSPLKEIPSKIVPTMKSPSVVERKKVVGSPKIKEREFKPVKKKKIATDETDSGKSLHDEDKTSSSVSPLSTPKLMIKVLPKSNEAVKSPKSSPVKSKIFTTPVKVKIPSSPSSSKALSMKLKIIESEIVAKSEKKAKSSSDSLGIAVLKKEHSKKKKKKKDKDKEKGSHKEKHKSDKAELPIPKFRFKLDPSGESKSSETKTSSKSSTIPGHSSSKKSSKIVIETENVMSSVITETLSNTLDYDPDRAYFCPVCHKQDDGSPMVGCDGCDEWCHWTCVGLMAAPPDNEKWHCPLCLLRKEKKKKGKSKRKS